MLVKDIQPGVVYAHRVGTYGSVKPVVFLAKPAPDTLYTKDRFPSGARKLYHRSGSSRPSAKSGVGWPAVLPKRHGGDLQPLLDADLEAFTSLTPDTRDQAPVDYTLVTSPAHIVGVYAEILEAQRLQEEQDRQERRARQERQEAAARYADQIIDELAKRGVSAHRTPQGGVVVATVRAENALALLELIRQTEPRD